MNHVLLGDEFYFPDSEEYGPDWLPEESLL